MANITFNGLKGPWGLICALAACGGEDPNALSTAPSSESGTTSFGQSTSTLDTGYSGATDGESTSEPDFTTGGSTGCTVEFGSPSLVSSLPFGGLDGLDLSDGGRAVVAPEGSAVLLDVGPPEPVQLVEDPPEGRMEVGALRGDAVRNDILYLAAGGAFSVFADVDDDSPVAYQGSISASVYSTLADFNEDGKDDVVLLANSYDRIEIWDLALGEQAEILAQFEVKSGLPTVGRARPFQQFPALALYTDDQIHGIRLEGATLVEDFAFEAIGAYAIEGLVPQAGEDRRLLISSFFQQGASGTNSIAISARQQEEQVWVHRRAELDMDLTVLFAPQAGDLDRDGRTDVVAVGRQGGMTSVVGLCSRGDELRECASQTLGDGTLGLFISSDGAATNIFIARGDDGLWKVSAEGHCG